MQKFGRLEPMVFVCGAAVMAIELLGTRIVAPWMGNTLFVWTALIAVILGSLSLGYWLGGKMADRKPSMEKLSLVILGAGIYAALIPFISVFALPLGVVAGAVYGPLIAAIILFAVPAILLGIVSPYAVKLKAHELSHVGGTAGSLYALSTLGSIVGTVAAGFFLIPSFGVKSIMLGVSASLVLAALVGLSEKMRVPALFAFIVVAVLAILSPAGGSSNVIFEKDSPYYHIKVVDSNDGTRVLMLDRDTHSGMDTKSGGLVFEYTKCSLLALALEPHPEKILFLGLGAGTEQAEFARRTNASIETAEIDPELPGVASRYFGFNESARNSVSVGDGRVFLSKLDGSYGIVMVDVFNSFSIPAHLATVETVREIKGHLGNDGLVVVNVISAFSGKKSLMFRSLYKTYAQEFRTIYVFPVGEKADGVQNIIFIATERDRVSKDELVALAEKYDPALKKWAGKNFEGGIGTEDVPILTDDYAPVDNLMAPIFEGYDG